MAKGNRDNDKGSTPPPARSVNKLKNEFKLDQVHPCPRSSCQNVDISLNDYNQILSELKSNHKAFTKHVNQIYPHADIRLFQYNPKLDPNSNGKIDFANFCLFGRKSDIELLDAEDASDSLKLNFMKRFKETTSFEKSEFCQAQLSNVQTKEEVPVKYQLKLEDGYLKKFFKDIYYFKEDSFEFKKIIMSGKEYLELTFNQNKKRSEVCITHRNPRICYLLDDVVKKLVVMIDLDNNLPFPSAYFTYYTAYQDDNLLDFIYQIRE